MQTSDFNFELPPELIAQAPAPQRDQSRLLVVRRGSGEMEHRQFGDLLEFLQSGDALVLNNSRVIPARLRGASARTSGRFEVLLLEETAVNDWWAMLRPGKRAQEGTQIEIRDPADRPTGVRATVVEKNDEGHRRLRFTGTPNIMRNLEELGEVPLPPYIERAPGGAQEADRQRYQTVFAEPAGSVAAPTAGLHFTRAYLAQIRARGVKVCFVTLHVGPGTFAPVKSETLAAHKMHKERFELNEETVRIINDTKSSGRRIIAVGTTSVRVLESAAATRDGRSDTRADSFVPLKGGTGQTGIFIYPPYQFKIVDGLVTNFHLPRSTLLMLVSAFAAGSGNTGRELILSAYREAIRERYRFFSYGDAMLIL